MTLRPLTIITALLLSLASASCVPWVVRPIKENGNDKQMSGESFDAGTYVASIWDSRVMPAADTETVDIESVLPVSICRLVKGEGRVTGVDRTSRAERLLVDLPPYEGSADIALQIGPVVRGMALRDSLSFIQFSDFINQLDFARVGNELNSYVESRVLEPISRNDLEGRIVFFAGALSPAEGDREPELTPLKLAFGGPAP